MLKTPSMLKKKRVLITGANGFIGRSLINKLSQNDSYEVIGTSRSKNTDPKFSAFIQINLLSESQINKLFPSQIDLVIHCAAQTGLCANKDIFMQNNFQLTKNVVDMSKKNNVKEIIFISTPSVYMCSQNQIGIKENQVKDSFVTAYAESKFLCEKYLESLKESFQSILIMRPATVYGPGANNLSTIIKNFRKLSLIPHFKEKPPVVNLTYIDNLVHAIDSIIDQPKKNFDIYNFSDEEEVSFVKEFLYPYFKKNKISFKEITLPFSPVYYLSVAVQKIYSILKINKDPFISPYIVCNLGRDKTLNIDKFKSQFDYRSLHSFSKGKKLFLEWMDSGDHHA